MRGFDLKQIALFAWLPFLAADLGCMFGGTISITLQKYAGMRLDQRAAQRVHGGRAADDGRGVRRHGARIHTSAIALLSLAGFAHQTLSVTVITMASDLFKRSEVATVAGMAGTCGNAGVLIFSLLMGALVTRIGYTPFFVGLAALDLLGAVHPVDRRARAAATTRCVPLPSCRSVHSQSDPSRVQSRSVDRSRRRRLLHRDVDVRMVSRACRSTTRAISCTGGC